MRYCSNCGEEIGDAQFCPHCGKMQYPEQYTEKSCSDGRRLHCPYCRSTKLMALVENADASNITKSAASKGFGLSMSGITANRNYWMCIDCGHKFRNIENLQAEIDYTEKEMKKWRKWGIVAGIVTVILMIIAASSDDIMMVCMMAPFCLSALYACAGFWVSRREEKQYKTLTEEKAILEKNCYN